MGRKQVREERRRKKPTTTQAAGFWPGLTSRINEGMLIPIISDAVYTDLIFDMDNDGVLGISADEDSDEMRQYSIREQLAQEYAKWSDFPLTEGHRLARVSLFNSVLSETDKLWAKREYLQWLKEELCDQAQYDPDLDSTILEELQDDLDKPFSYFVNYLGYPKVKTGRDPLDLLAKLKLPIYITTSYFDFLERALVANGVEPRTQICFWNGQPHRYIDEIHQTDHGLEPSNNNPIVYHLFGHEAYPQSLVLTEDDFLDFLVKLSADFGQNEPIVPHYLRERLALSSLLLLGYRPGDWDFRVMFRGLIAAASNIEMFNLAIQFDPAQRPGAVSTEEIKAYLERYFKPRFNVEWDSAAGFITKLYAMWDRQRR